MANRLIDAAEIENLFYAQVEHGATDLMDAFDDALQDAPTVDAVEVVRCAQCKYFGKDGSGYYDDEFYCTNPSGLDDIVKPSDFCSYGERKGGQAPQREDV